MDGEDGVLLGRIYGHDDLEVYGYLDNIFSMWKRESLFIIRDAYNERTEHSNPHTTLMGIF